VEGEVLEFLLRFFFFVRGCARCGGEARGDCFALEARG